MNLLNKSLGPRFNSQALNCLHPFLTMVLFTFAFIVVWYDMVWYGTLW